MTQQEEAQQAIDKAKKNLEEAYTQLITALLKGEFNTSYRADLHEISLSIHQLNKKL